MFVDGHLLESQMFFAERLSQYPSALAAVVEQYTSDGWTEEPVLKTEN